MKTLRILTPIFLLLFTVFCYGQDYELSSPDGKILLKINISDHISWSADYNEKQVINPSSIIMNVNDNVELGTSPKVAGEKRAQNDEILTPVVPVKSSKIKDQYNQLSLTFKGNYSIDFRTYNDGVAYRFNTSFKKQLTVNHEVLELNFPENTVSYFPEEETMISHYERIYEVAKLDTLSSGKFCSLPVLMDVNDTKVLFTEADLYDYPGMFLFGTNGNGLRSGFPKYILEAKPAETGGDRNQKIVEEAEYIAKTSGTRSFPWRVCVIGDDKTLLETNLVYQLSRPLALKNTDWIKPGLVAWDWYNALNIYGVDFESGVNTETYKYYIDFAAKYGLDYIILDEGWSKSTTNITEPNPDIDVRELVEYGKNKNVGVILWMLWKPLDDDLENILQTYEGWGVKGVKVDFMQRADQGMVNYYERVLKEAAKHKLLVDFHGAYKPSGFQRAYPNFISNEGVKGNENNKWSADVTPEHTVILPFTRMVAGPMDFTPGAMENAQERNYHISFMRPMSLGTRCHQVAMYVLYESPLQMLCDAPSDYLKDKTIVEFISQIPTVWDETIALDAKVADYLLVAKRNGDNWYVGAMTDWTSRQLEVDFSFLPEGDYQIEIIQDGTNAGKYAEDYKLVSKEIDNSTKMKITLAPGGGWAAIVTPKK